MIVAALTGPTACQKHITLSVTKSSSRRSGTKMAKKSTLVEKDPFGAYYPTNNSW